MYEKYRDKVNFILVYVIEPHPVGSKSPYSKEEWTGSFSWDKQDKPVYQPETYDQRLQLAVKLIEDEAITRMILVDTADNKVWKAYGPAPNLAYLIGTDRKVLEAQEWYSQKEMEAAIKKIN